MFDSRQHALPVAWIITPSFAKPDISKWMKSLVGRIRAVDTGWKVSGFVIDDAAAELEPIRQATYTIHFVWEIYSYCLLNLLFTFVAGIYFVVLCCFLFGVSVEHGLEI